MTIDPKTSEPGSAEHLGLKRHDTPARHEQDDAPKTEEDGEPFDGNFA